MDLHKLKLLCSDPTLLIISLQESEDVQEGTEDNNVQQWRAAVGQKH